MIPVDLRIESGYLEPGVEFGDNMCLCVSRYQGGMGETYRCLQVLSKGPDFMRFRQGLIDFFEPEHYLNIAHLILERVDPNSPRYDPQIARREKHRIQLIADKKSACEDVLGQRGRIFGQGGIERLKKELGLKPYETIVRPTLGKYLDNEIAQGEPETSIKFFHEMALHGYLSSHTNIADVYRTYKGPKGFWIIIEYIDGQNLKTILGQRPAIFKAKALTPVEASIITLKVARGLGFMHSSGIVDRDVKSSNVMIRFSDGEVIVIDLGTAEMIGEETGKSVISAHYASPEETLLSVGKTNSIKVDPRSDIFSLGCLYYELLTGEKPFMDIAGGFASNLLDKGYKPKPIKKHYNEKMYKDGSQKRLAQKSGYSYNKRLDSICSKMLEKDINKRCQNAGEIIDDLTAFLEEAGINERDHNRIIKDLIEPHDKARREDLQDKISAHDKAETEEDITRVVQ
jgi:serine/threonine protein kinase